MVLTNAKVNVIGAKKLTPDLQAELEQQIEQLLKSAAPDAIARAKARRFTTSSRLLTGKQTIDVRVVDLDDQAPAWYEVRKKKMWLNEAHPRTNDPVEALIYDRGKLFHELFHELFTRHLQRRATLAKKSTDAQLFLDLSNMLEDGRIEWLGSQKWQGSGFYLDTLLMQLMKTCPPHPINGLVLFVRKQIWRNEGEAKFWQPFIPRVLEAIRAISTAKVCDIAFEITEELCKLYPKPPQPPQPPDNPDPEGDGEGEGEGEPTDGGGKGKTPECDVCPDCGLPVDKHGKAMKFAMHVCPTCGGTHEDTDDGDDDGGADGDGDNDDEGDDADDDDGDTDGGVQTDGGHGGGAGHGGDNLDVLDEDVKDRIQKMVDEAKKRVEDEAVDDYESIVNEALTETEPEQEFPNGNEEMLADDLSAIFTSLLVEANREKRHVSREGRLNTLALPKALTNQRCFERSEIAPSPPYVALLIDVSGSMRYSVEQVTQAARVLHGALLKAKVKVLTMTFDSDLQRHATIPLKSFRVCGSTATGVAMQAANRWLEDEGAQRALVIVITDGDPNSTAHVKDQKQAIEDNGGRVIGVLLQGYHPSDVGDQFHDHILCDDVANLAALLEPKLADFVTGA